MAVVPKSLIFVVRQPKKPDTDTDVNHPDVFVVNKDSPNSLKTALKWANGGHFSSCNYYKQPVELEFDNKPFSDVVIKSLEMRGEGGRAYKIIIKDKYRIDFREDALMDVILNSGIRAGGKLNGEFVFAQFGSQMKLVRVGSVLWAQAIQDTEAKKLSIIPVTQLRPGCCYETAAGKIQIFYGMGHLVHLVRQRCNGRQAVEGVFVKRSMQIWSDYSTTRDDFDANDISEYLKSILNPLSEYFNNNDFSIKNNHTFVRVYSNTHLDQKFTPCEIRKARFDKFLSWKPLRAKREDKYFELNFYRFFDHIPYSIGETIEIPQNVLDKIKQLFTHKILKLDNLAFHLKG